MATLALPIPVTLSISSMGERADDEAGWQNRVGLRSKKGAHASRVSISASRQNPPWRNVKASHVVSLRRFVPRIIQMFSLTSHRIQGGGFCCLKSPVFQTFSGLILNLCLRTFYPPSRKPPPIRPPAVPQLRCCSPALLPISASNRANRAVPPPPASMACLLLSHRAWPSFALESRPKRSIATGRRSA